MMTNVNNDLVIGRPQPVIPNIIMNGYNINAIIKFRIKYPLCLKYISQILNHN